MRHVSVILIFVGGGLVSNAEGWGFDSWAYVALGFACFLAGDVMLDRYIEGLEKKDA